MVVLVFCFGPVVGRANVPPPRGEIMRNIFHTPSLFCFEEKNKKCQRKLHLELQR